MKVTISDIARESGVSQTTVSRVLNNSGYVKDETREKILKIIKEKKYIPSAIARGLSTKKTNTIGVVVPDINNPFFGEVIKGIGEIADKYNFNIILCNTNDNVKKEIKALEVLKEQRIEGIVITPSSVEDEFNSEYLKDIQNFGIPVVLAEGQVKFSDFSGVFTDNIKGAYEAISALTKNGHTKIAIITGRMNTKSAKDRLEGYKKALMENNLNIDEEYILYGDYKEQSGYNLTKEILTMKDRPTAIFVSSNLMTFGAVKAIYEKELSIPKDISIIGYDNLEILNIVGLNISYVSAPAREIGIKSMKLLIERLKNSNKTKTIVLKPNVTLKGSEKYINA